jgi:hypothetical protein
MPVEVNFQGNQHVYIHFVFQTPWTFKEFRDAQKIAHAWVRNLDYTVDTILDLADTPALPSYAISEGLDAIARTQKQPNLGNTVVVTHSFLVQHVIQVISHLAPTYGLHVVQDMHEAEQIIAHSAKEQTFFNIAHPEKYTILALN